MILQWTSLAHILHIPCVYPSFCKDTLDVFCIRSTSLLFTRISVRSQFCGVAVPLSPRKTSRTEVHVLINLIHLFSLGSQRLTSAWQWSTCACVVGFILEKVMDPTAEYYQPISEYFDRGARRDPNVLSGHADNVDLSSQHPQIWRCKRLVLWTITQASDIQRIILVWCLTPPFPDRTNSVRLRAVREKRSGLRLVWCHYLNTRIAFFPTRVGLPNLRHGQYSYDVHTSIKKQHNAG